MYKLHFFALVLFLSFWASSSVTYNEVLIIEAFHIVLIKPSEIAIFCIVLHAEQKPAEIAHCKKWR